MLESVIVSIRKFVTKQMNRWIEWIATLHVHTQSEIRYVPT